MEKGGSLGAAEMEKVKLADNEWSGEYDATWQMNADDWFLKSDLITRLPANACERDT